MAPSRPLRRLVGAFALLAFLLPAQVPAGAGSAPRLRSELGGDRGTGPPPLAKPLAKPLAQTATNGIKWSDVPKNHWARTAIDFVGATYDWMRDFPPSEDGSYPFQPDALESRQSFARSVVRAFAPDEPTDPNLTFPDLPPEDPFEPYANVAVKLGWMTVDADGNFLPADPVTTRMVHRALVLAVGLGDPAKGVDAIHTRDGTTFEMPPDFGTLLIGMLIGLRYNHGDESLDVGPDTPLPRAEVAWSVYRAATIPSWTASWLAPYATIRLPNLGPTKRRIVQFGIDFVGYPYVYAGEWYQASPDGYCCGYQPVGGFDCSGITWWVMKAAASGWNNVPPRDYRGWSLPQRTSTDMASTGQKVKKYEDLRAGDLMFYDGSGDGIIDHVDVYIGNGWAIDSSGGMGGVTIMQVSEGWYRDHFVWGRRLLGTNTTGSTAAG